MKAWQRHWELMRPRSWPKVVSLSRQTSPKRRKGGGHATRRRRRGKRHQVTSTSQTTWEKSSTGRNRESLDCQPWIWATWQRRRKRKRKVRRAKTEMTRRGITARPRVPSLMSFFAQPPCQKGWRICAECTRSHQGGLHPWACSASRRWWSRPLAGERQSWKRSHCFQQ